MRPLSSYKKLLIAVIFYDHHYDNGRPSTLFSSDISAQKILLLLCKIIAVYPLSVLASLVLRIFAIRYKVSIYVLKPFRPSTASNYIGMVEPLCRQLQHEDDARHIKILVDPGQSVSDVLVKSCESHFDFYLDDRRKFLRLIAYLIPKSGLDKQFINTSNKFLSSWLLQPSINYSNLKNEIPADLADLGIKKSNFVLFAHSSRSYYQSRLASAYLPEMEHMFYDLSTYSLALSKLIENNLKVIRVGLDVDELPETLKELPIIDYTGDIRNEESELWLYENCKFLVSAANGAFWFARRFDRPTLITDSYVLPLGYFSTLYTPKIIRDKVSGKFLTFADVLSIRSSTNFLSNQFMQDRHLEFLPNTSTTIANAVTEMTDLVNGQNPATPEDLDLMRRYKLILTSFNIPILDKITVPTFSFLREYSSLL